MAYNIISNKKNTSAVIHVFGGNSSLTIAGNSSVSNLAIQDEVLTGAYITQAVWGCDGTGYILIKRGANSVMVLDSTGQHDYAGCGMPIRTNENATLDIQFVGSTNCALVLEVQKVGSFKSEYFQP